ncbi:MAG: hypothetical protein WBQ18_14190 [Solirubrobacteraceae bacterium]
MSSADPDLDRWLANPALRVAHRRQSSAEPDELWEAARQVRLADAALLGRLVRWRIPGLAREERFDDLFREPPFVVLEEGEHLIVSGLVGRIWTLRRDYPELGSPDEFAAWSRVGTARVVIANWVAPAAGGRHALASEARVEAIGARGRLGVGAVRPLVRSFGPLVGSDGIAAAVRRAERGG